MNKLVREQVFARAAGVCECGCAQPLGEGELDHFFGRAKADETVAACWALRRDCHRAKTDNRPSAVQWLLKFIRHSGIHAGSGYATAGARAQQQLEWKSAKGFA